jgi:hypothetical protein
VRLIYLLFVSSLLIFQLCSPPAECPSLSKEDEELLREDEVVTPVKPEGIRRKDRPTDKGMSWLVKTQYISSLSTESAKMVCFLYLHHMFFCMISWLII